MTGYYVRGALLSAYAEAARGVGLEPMRKLRQAGLPISALDNPDLEISSSKLMSLLRDSAQAAGRDDFALLTARAYRLSMLGPRGLLLRQQANLREAFRVFSQYRTWRNSALETLVDETGAFPIVHARIQNPDARTDPLVCDLALGFVVRIVQSVLGPDWRPLCVYASRPAPADPAAHLEMFGAVEFDQDFDGVAISLADLERPIPASDPDMARELARCLDQIGGGARLGLVDRVDDLVRRLLPAGSCTIEEVAVHLGVTRRTVHRQLAREGLSFGDLVERVRREIVAARLPASDGTLGALAERLGFSSLSTFSRWFRSAYGCCAREFRDAA